MHVAAPDWKFFQVSIRRKLHLRSRWPATASDHPDELVLYCASRWTRIRYSSGAELFMDHNAVAGYIRQNGEACAIFGSDGTMPRREAHYRALYKSWLTKQDQIFSTDTSARLHALLLANGS